MSNRRKQNANKIMRFGQLTSKDDTREKGNTGYSWISGICESLSGPIGISQIDRMSAVLTADIYFS
jgi:hypothetical protein